MKEEEEKAKIQKDLSILTDRLSKINESLSRKNQARNEYDKTIQETEAAYMKILESSQTLLHVLKRESVNLTKKQSSSQYLKKKKYVFAMCMQPSRNPEYQ